MPQVVIKNLLPQQQQIMLSDHTGENLHTFVLGRRQSKVVDESQVTQEILRRTVGQRKTLKITPA